MSGKPEFRCRRKDCGRVLTARQHKAGGGLCPECLREGLCRIAADAGRRRGA